MKKKVLIVDDNELVREVTKEIIESKNDLQTCKATNGKEALQLLQNNTFDLLIVDIAMDEIDEIELIDKLRSSSSSIPIIVLSGGLNHNIIEYLKSKKQIIFIEKPYSMETLVASVEKIIS